jgi:SOS-response transcriptional repressor LexA
MEWSRIVQEAERIICAGGKSRADLAEILGVTPQFIADVKSGKSKNPRPSFALSLVTKLNFRPDWLLSGEGEMLLNPLPSVQPGREVTKTGAGLKVPLLRQKVSCGPGEKWEDDSNIADYIDVFNLLPRLDVRRLFALCVEGTSMIGAGIRNGDYVLFDSAADQRFRDGTYVFALDGEVYCKRLEFDGISRKVKIYSVRVADLEKAELLTTIDMGDMAAAERLTIFGRVLYLVRPNTDDN